MVVRKKLFCHNLSPKRVLAEESMTFYLYQTAVKWFRF